MEKIRQSFRKSFRRKKSQNLTLNVKQKPNCVETSGSIHNGKNYCQLDETAVRSAACSFQVKYLGACEVFDSRGMHICESALQQLRLKKQSTKAILYVTGDGLRLVDQQDNRGLILDQTIEKVSFCAPDRSDDKSFAYICRDGASKRWMCHGFLSIQENVNGERLSHAVGCAFTICLEKKQIRDVEVKDKKENQVKTITNNNFERVFESTPSLNYNGLQRHTSEYASFRRKLSLVERKLDPQTAIIHNNPLKQTNNSFQIEKNYFLNSLNQVTDTAKNSQKNFTNATNLNLQNFINSTTIKPRPASNLSLFKRQGSFQTPLSLLNTTMFKRFNSLRVDLPLKNSTSLISAVNTEPIYEGDESCSTELICNNLNESKSNFSNDINLFASTSSDLFSDYKNLSFNTKSTSSPTNKFFPEFQCSENSKKADEWLSEVLSNSCIKFSKDSSPVSTVSAFQTHYNQNSSTEKNLFKSHLFDTSIYDTKLLKSPNQMQRTYTLPQLSSKNLQLENKNDLTLLSPATTNKENNRLLNTDFLHTSTVSERSNVLKNTKTNLKNAENSKKNLTTRLSIEYQLLEETDAPPQSPSKQNSDVENYSNESNSYVQNNSNNLHISTSVADNLNNFNINLSNNEALNTLNYFDLHPTSNTDLMISKDPFDVQWSTEVLKNSAKRKDNVEKSLQNFIISNSNLVSKLNGQKFLTKPILNSTETSFSLASNLDVFLPVTLATNTNPFCTN